MAQVFVLQNQHKGLLNKRGEWCDGRDARSLFNTLHQDEAINQKIEVNAKDYTLRISILECERNDKGVPLLKDEDLPPLGSCLTTPVKVEVEVDSSVGDSDTIAADVGAVLTAEEVTEANVVEAPVAEDDEAAIAAKIEAMLAAQAQLLGGSK